MKEKVNKILLNEYIINSSDLLEITNSSEFLNMIKDVDINKEIIVKSKLIHKNNISLLETILFGIDNYLSFLKNILNVNQLEIRYIAMLTIFNDNYLNNYIFCKQYLIFSNIKLTSKEASCLVDIIQTDEGFDLLYGKGIETTYARYIAFKVKIRVIEV